MYEHHRAELAVEVARFVRVVTDADLTTPVPTCPGWTLADLLEHHGTTHRWVEHVLRHRSRSRVRSREVGVDLPGEVSEYPRWLAAGVESLLTVLWSTDPDTPIWTVGADQHVRCWARRVLHEAVVHRADAELALGHTPSISTDTAVDGIEEFLTNAPCFPRISDRVGKLDRSGETLRLHGSSHEWLITLRPDGFRWERGHAIGTATVQGSVGHLLLLVYGRILVTDESLTVSGDEELLVRWLEAAAF